MSRLQAAFDQGPVLIPYITAGDPDLAQTIEYVQALTDAGADVIELGLPFSEPIADGPTIQNAITRALDAGVTPRDFFSEFASFDADVPLVVMTYYNLIHQFGEAGPVSFVSACKDAGIDGIIVPDLPVEESSALREACSNAEIDLVFIIAPTTTEERLRRILSHASGFVYVQARLGTTGVQNDVSTQTFDALSRLPSTELPVAVGFGVSTGDQAQAIVQAGADGVIAGSVFVDIIAEGTDVPARLAQKTRELKDGVLAGVESVESQHK